jgi:hypothetical protein
MSRCISTRVEMQQPLLTAGACFDETGEGMSLAPVFVVQCVPASLAFLPVAVRIRNYARSQSASPENAGRLARSSLELRKLLIFPALNGVKFPYSKDTVQSLLLKARVKG